MGRIRSTTRHTEAHVVGRLGWLRAAVLGANDGILSTASLIVGVAGAMSMAAGEYVSVSSQADSERADIARESQELRNDPASEHEELAQIYVKRGLDRELAHRVAAQLVVAVCIASLVFLALLGAVAAKTGGAPIIKATIRVTFWGALAMAVTAGIGAMFGTRL